MVGRYLPIFILGRITARLQAIQFDDGRYPRERNAEFEFWRGYWQIYTGKRVVKQLSTRDQ